MKTKIFISILLLGIFAGFNSCTQDPIHILDKGNFASDTVGTLKDAASFHIGFGIDYTPFMNDPAYKAVVTREADNVTFGYQMKHGAIVKDDGSFDFSKADALYDAATSAGLEVYGHTLVWYANQNANYVKNFAGVVQAAPVNLILNGGFESGTGDNFTNWNKYNGGTSFTQTTVASEIHSGARGLKVTVATDNPGGQWRVQLASDLINTTVDKQYMVSFWIKAASGNGSMRLSTQPTAQYQGDQTTSTAWSQITWTFTAKDAQTRILFDMGLKANTYFIDDVTFTEVIPAPSASQVADKLDTVLNRFIKAIVTHYKGKVKAWDVVNELFADNGSIRNNNNTTITPSDVIVYSNWMGKSLGVKAFTYAKQYDPNALLFINDYALESNNAKLDSLISYVNFLKAQGIQVDGIGTQMHVNINTSYTGIDNAFQKLGATGLKIRISELDVRLNPSDLQNFNQKVDPLQLAYQAMIYKYIVNSFMKNVPAAQQYGLTVWGVSDKDSWYVVSQNKNDIPLLFNGSYAKKPAYSGVLQALQGK